MKRLFRALPELPLILAVAVLFALLRQTVAPTLMAGPRPAYDAWRAFAVLSSMLIKRPFCRVICPLGLILSFFNRVSLFRLEVSSACNRCDVCQKLCPVDIKVYEDPNSDQCIRCLDCTACACVTKTGVPLRGGAALAGARRSS